MVSRKGIPLPSVQNGRGLTGRNIAKRQGSEAFLTASKVPQTRGIAEVFGAVVAGFSVAPTTFNTHKACRGKVNKWSTNNARRYPLKPGKQRLIIPDP